MSSSVFCPKCNAKMPVFDGKKLGGIPGNKYRVCLICKVIREVKHRVHDHVARKRQSKPRGGPIANR